MHNKKVSLLISPRTGENVSKLPDVLAILSAAGWKTDIALKEYPRHVMELANEAGEGKKDLIIAYGGDGTLNQVVNGVMSTKGQQSTVALLPGGTANVWAREVGIPTDPVKAALTLVNSEPRKVDVGRIMVHSITFPGEQPILVSGKIKKKVAQESKKVRHHFLLMAGLGIDAAIMGNVSKPLKYRLGPLAVGLSAAKELSVTHSFPIEIQPADAGADEAPLWKGEALQVVVGNTRRYAKVAKMTPDAYIDDGVLDVCVITAGTPLSTMQQLSSLLLRLKPDTATAEYFHGAHLLIKVPATVLFQVDGSAVKLKDYLDKADYDKLQQVTNKDQVMISYRVDTLPHALRVAIPRTYNDELFEYTASEQHTDRGRSPVKVQRPEKEDEQGETDVQKRAVEVISQSESQRHGKGHEQPQETSPDATQPSIEDGLNVTVIGKAPVAEKKDTYIIAGHITKERTGEIVPVAVVVNDKTTICDREGEHFAVVQAAMRDLHEGAVIVVEGKRNKRGVIQATCLAL